ncbi:unnamed protein product, partial [Brassica rapa]
QNKNTPWLSVPQFGDWDQKGGNIPDYSLDFSKIREMRKQNKRDPSRASLGNEEEDTINPFHNQPPTSHDNTKPSLDIQKEERTVQKTIKEAAKRNDMVSAKALAKEIVSSRRTVNKLYENKSQMNKLYENKASCVGIEEEVRRIKKEHHEDDGAIENDRVKGYLKHETSGWCDGGSVHGHVRRVGL